MITIDGIEYVNGTRVPVAPIREIVKKHTEARERLLDDDLLDWEAEHPIVEEIDEYIQTCGIVMNENGINNLIKELQDEKKG